MWHDINWSMFYSPGLAYAQSKLANVLHAKALARKLEVTFSREHMVSFPVRFSSFFSGGFITAIVVNPPERKLAKRTSVRW